MRRLEVREEPQAVKEALGDNERALRKSLTWGHAAKAAGLVR